MQSRVLQPLFSLVSEAGFSAFTWNNHVVQVYPETKPIETGYRFRLVYQNSDDNRETIEQWLIALDSDFHIALLNRNSHLEGLELTFPQKPNQVALDKLSLLSESEYFQVEKPLPILNKPGLFVMDMDSTAIEIECIDELARLAGVGDEVSEVTERAMQGELDFEQSLRQRVAKLAGADARIIDSLCETLPVTKGLADSIAELQKLGWRTIVASGGFTPFVNHLKNLLSLDEAYANELVFDNGRFSGTVTGDVVDAQYKADVLAQGAERWGIEPQQCVAIGDGANDIPMLNQSGFGLAYHAKPKLQEVADVHIAKLDLACLPFLFRLV